VSLPKLSAELNERSNLIVLGTVTRASGVYVHGAFPFFAHLLIELEDVLKGACKYRRIWVLHERESKADLAENLVGQRFMVCAEEANKDGNAGVVRLNGLLCPESEEARAIRAVLMASMIVPEWTRELDEPESHFRLVGETRK
jgi:hypothetical protein